MRAASSGSGIYFGGATKLLHGNQATEEWTAPVELATVTFTAS